MASVESTASAEPEVETGIGDEVVAGIVADKQKKPGNETVAEFGEDVEKQAKEKVEVIREHAGDAVADAVGPEIMASAEGFSEAKNNVLDPDGIVGDAKSKGAVAYVDMADRKKVFDAEAMTPGMTAEQEAFWNRTNKHETVHETEQAQRFDANALQVYDRKTQKVKTFAITGNKRSAGAIEGQSSMKNRQSDVPESYWNARNEWVEMTGMIGKQRAEKMMETGRVRDTQRELMRGALGPQMAMK